MMLVVAILSVTCFALTGCSKIEGTYKFKSMSGKMDGVEVNIEANEKFFGLFSLPEDFITLTLNADSTCTMTSAEDEDAVETGKWRKSDKNIKVTIDGETHEFEISGRDLIFNLELEGVDFEIVLSK